MKKNILVFWVIALFINCSNRMLPSDNQVDTFANDESFSEKSNSTIDTLLESDYMMISSMEGVNKLSFKSDAFEDHNIEYHITDSTILVSENGLNAEKKIKINYVIDYYGYEYFVHTNVPMVFFRGKLYKLVTDLEGKGSHNKFLVSQGSLFLEGIKSDEVYSKHLSGLIEIDCFGLPRRIENTDIVYYKVIGVNDEKFNFLIDCFVRISPNAKITEIVDSTLRINNVKIKGELFYKKETLLGKYDVEGFNVK